MGIINIKELKKLRDHNDVKRLILEGKILIKCQSLKIIEGL